MPRLIVNAGTPQAIEFVLKPGANYIGRGFANDFKLDDPSVSGSHAQFILNGKEVTVKDLGSTNGTFINRMRITEAVLQPGQYIRLGGIELLLQADGETEIATRAQRTQVPVSAPIVGEFRISGTPLVAGRTGDTATQIVRPPPEPVAAAAATAHAPSPVVAAAMPMAIPAPAAAPAPVAAPSPVVLRIPTPQPPQPAPTPHVSPQAASPAAARPAGIRINTTPVAQDPPLTAIVAEPPVPGMVEPPAGKTACKYHPNNPGHFLCQTCNQLFCSICVSSRRMENTTGYFCRTCGNQCVPVKVRFTPKKDKGPKQYSDVTILVRSVGFALAGALLGGGIWTGFAAMTGTDMPPLLCPMIGLICGFAVKFAAQDRPGVIFSMIAVVATLLGISMGKAGAFMVTQNFIFTINSLAFATFGLLFGLFLAWKFGGGDF